MPNAKTPVKVRHDGLNDDTEPTVVTVPRSTAKVLTSGGRGWEYVDDDDKPKAAEATPDAPPPPAPPARPRTTAGTPGQEV